jgi:putative ABC transport system permease protein
MVVREGAALTVVGVAIGLPGAATATRSLSSLLFGVSHADPVTYAGVIVLVMATAALSSGAPAWRAARVDPAETLKAC